LIFRVGRAPSSRSRRPADPVPRPSTQIVGTFARPTGPEGEGSLATHGADAGSGEARGAGAVGALPATCGPRAEAIDVNCRNLRRPDWASGRRFFCHARI